MTKPVLVMAGALLLWSGAVRGQGTVQPDAAPVNPAATPAARALLREIDGISGRRTMSGEHNFPNTVSRYSDRVYELTGAYPAVFGQDFGFSGGEDKDSTLGRPAMIAEVIRQYRAGSVIALTWHAVKPSEDEPVTFRDSVQGHLTDWEFEQVLTPGTELHRRWERQVDVVAGYLKELQAAGVPVLFRPYHEMNGNWFWWGGRPGAKGTAALYRQIFDRYVHVHHLDNLIWVWNVNAPSGNAGPVEQYFPGPGYADVVSMDIYGAFEQRFYESMLALAGAHTPIALAEVGTMPTPETLRAQPKWAYFMMWSGSAEGSNTPEQLQTMFHAPEVIHRGDALLPKPLAAPTGPPLPEDAAATPAARALLAKLYRGTGGDRSGGVRGERAQVVEIEVTGTAGAELAERVAAVAKAGQVPLLRWRPASPTGGAAALSDFEWTELRRPGSGLHAAWLREVDALLPLLQELDRRQIAYLWSAVPGGNGTEGWWAGRPGAEGSRAVVKEVHERLVSGKAGGGAVWVWEAAMGSMSPGRQRPAGLEEFYPGPLGVDALLLDAAKPLDTRGYGMRAVLALAGGKPVGLRTPVMPVGDAGSSGFAWVTVAPANGAGSAAAPAP